MYTPDQTKQPGAIPSGALPNLRVSPHALTAACLLAGNVRNRKRQRSRFDSRWRRAAPCGHSLRAPSGRSPWRRDVQSQLQVARDADSASGEESIGLDAPHLSACRCRKRWFRRGGAHSFASFRRRRLGSLRGVLGRQTGRQCNHSRVLRSSRVLTVVGSVISRTQDDASVYQYGLV